MKNLSLILNIVLLLAVGVLFYLHFSSTSPKSTGSVAVAAGDLTIAYINSDSVTKHYKFVEENKTVLEAKAKKLDADLNNRANALRGEIAAYQRNVSSMTIGQAKALEEDLGKKQQNLQMYQQSLNQQMAEDENKFYKDLYDRITAYLKIYGEQNGLQVIFKHDPTSDLMYGAGALDISNAVIEGLNQEYADAKAGIVKTKTDTVSNK